MEKLDQEVGLRWLIDNGLLNDSENYLRHLFKNCRDFENEFGEFRVRIGLSGSGYAPNYIIEFASKPTDEQSDEEVDLPMVGKIGRRTLAYLGARNTAFNGRSHKRFVSGLDGDNWSNKADDKAEIETLLNRFVEQRKRAKTGKL